MKQNTASYIQPYIDLVEKFITDQIDAQGFEKLFLELFKKDSTQFNEREYEILNNLFYDVEDFCANPDIRDDEDLDEKQLKTRSKKHLEKLRAL